jgi:hypothetical protein
MPRPIDELRHPGAGTGRDDPASVVDIFVVDLFPDAHCKLCGDQGLFDMICPGCGTWDLRTMDEIEDAAGSDPVTGEA